MSVELFSVIVGIVFGYGTLAGVSFHLAGNHWYDPGPFFAGVLWPIVLPGIVGNKLVNYYINRNKIPTAKVINE